MLYCQPCESNPSLPLFTLYIWHSGFQHKTAHSAVLLSCFGALHGAAVRLHWPLQYSQSVGNTLCADSCSATYMGQACSGLCLVHVEGLKETNRSQTRVPPVPFVRPLADLILVPCYVRNDVSHLPSAYKTSRHNKAKRWQCNTICA